MQITRLHLIAFTAMSAMFSNSYAHHGVGDDVDLENFLDLKGEIELVEWINPHVVIHLTTEDARGFTQKWLLQADTPNSLLRKGINRRSLEHMTNIEIRAYPSLSAPCANECYAYGYEYRTPNGRTYTLHQAMYELVHQLTLQQNRLRHITISSIKGQTAAQFAHK